MTSAYASGTGAAIIVSGSKRSTTAAGAGGPDSPCAIAERERRADRIKRLPLTSPRRAELVAAQRAVTHGMLAR